MKTTRFSILYYVLNVCGLTFGAYLVLAYSIYRILVLYCLFNLVLYWITEKGNFATEGTFSTTLGNSKIILTSIAMSVIVLLCILTIGSYGKLYARPSSMPALLAITLGLVTILALASINAHGRPFFASTRFLLPTLISITLFVNFSIYLVQPDVFARPLFATVDAYRDYANAARIVQLAGFRPEYMIAEKYYAAFPVVPILNAVFSLVAPLPIQDGQIIIAATFEVLGVVGVWILSTAVVRRVDPPLAASASALATALVWLQPYFVEPGFFFTPLRFTVPLVTLIVYMLYQSMTYVRPLGRYVLLSVLILVMAITPMAPTSTLVVIAFCVLTGLLTRRHRRLQITVAVITFVFFGWYLLAAVAVPLTSMLVYVKETYNVLAEILSKGLGIIGEAAISATIVKLGELVRFMEVLPLALVLSICTTCIVKSRQHLAQDLRDRRLGWLHFGYGMIATAGLGGGYVAYYLMVDMRYFAFPVSALVVIACASVLAAALRSVTSSRLRGVILLGIMFVYAVSMANSPVVLYESNASQARLIPTESEMAAAYFVIASLRAEAKPSPQVLSDWPFYAYVRGVLLSSDIGIENKTRIVTLMFESPGTGKDTVVILRQYYLQSQVLETISPYAGVLGDVGKWNSPHHCKVFDSSTTWVYVGMFNG
jgi:hypothetical protein